MATEIKEDENLLVLQNIRMVKKIARMLKPHNANELDEFIQAGMIGLMNAIRKHDPKKGKLSTISWNYIKWEIIRYIKKTNSQNLMTEKLPKTSEQHFGVATENRDCDFSDMIPDWMTEADIKILSLKRDGHSLTSISKMLNIENTKLGKIYNSLIKKIKKSNE